MPVFFAGGETHDVAGADFLYGAAFTLNPATSRGDDQHLPEGWVCHAVRAPGSNVTVLPRLSTALKRGKVGRCGPSL